MPREQEAFRVVHQSLVDQLQVLADSSAAFRDIEQAKAVLALVFDQLLPAYRVHHRDLLFHQRDNDLFRPFLLGRMCEAVLSEGPPWNENERIVESALARLNDFIGHRPIAVLENGGVPNPMRHGTVRPVPLYITGAGFACGKYQALVSSAMDVLRKTDREILQAACFDPDVVEELAFDPRATTSTIPSTSAPIIILASGIRRMLTTRDGTAGL